MSSFFSFVVRPLRASASLLRRGRRAAGGIMQEGPPDLDEVLRKLRQNIQRLMRGLTGDSDAGGSPPGNGSGGDHNSSGALGKGGIFGMFTILLGLLAVIILYNSIHIIDEQERGVVLRFGKHAATLNPGLSIRFPRPIEQVIKVNVSEVSRYKHDNALMLTSDENIVNISVAVQYIIGNPEDYVFQVRDPSNTLKKSVESAVREVVGKNKIDFVITDGRREISIQQRELLQETLDRYKTGLSVVGFELQTTRAPDEVSAAFDDATAAREDNRRLVEEAEAYRNDIIPRARGSAARMIEEAEAYKARIVESALGEAERFLSQYEAYADAPDITRRRLYLETVQEVLQSSSKTMITDTGSAPLIYLPLDKMLHSSAADDQSRGSSSNSQRSQEQRGLLPRESTPPRMATDNRRRASR